MSLVSLLFKSATDAQQTPVVLTKAERILKEIEQCDSEPLKVYNSNLTCTMGKLTELNATHVEELRLYKKMLLEAYADAIVHVAR